MKTSEQIEDYLKTYSVGCAEAQAEKNGLLTALKIAEAHEAEYGWQPIETAPKNGRLLTWQFRSGVDGDGMWCFPVFAYWHHQRKCWVEYDSGLTTNPDEWYRFEEETK